MKKDLYQSTSSWNFRPQGIKKKYKSFQRENKGHLQMMTNQAASDFFSNNTRNRNVMKPSIPERDYFQTMFKDNQTN